MEQENQVVLDETAMELCQKLKKDLMTDDIAYLCKLGLSLLLKKYSNRDNENNNNTVNGITNVSQNNIPPACTQKGMSETVIKSHMKRFNITKEDYDAEYLKMIMHYKKKGKNELYNIEQLMFFWLRHYEKEKTIDQINIYHTRGYSGIIHDIGIPICVADSHLIRFNLNIDIYNNIVEYFYLSICKKQYDALPNIPPAMPEPKKVEDNIYGLCKKYYNKNQEFLNELSAFINERKEFKEQEERAARIKRDIKNLSNQMRVQFPINTSQPYLGEQIENGF